MIDKLKDDAFAERIVWCMFGVVILCFLVFAVSPHKEINRINSGRKHVTIPHISGMSEFSVHYKDGHIGRYKASSVIYGIEDDKIYFLGQFKDTIQILPKVMVEDIQEISTK